MEYRFEQVDVFTRTRFAGNPLAVFTDGRGLADGDMQRIAREMNLSETTFVTPSERADCVARYRIFTPDWEMPFAGHPTVGTAYVLARAGMVPPGATAFSLEANVGPVPIRLEGDPRNPDALFFNSPRVEFGARFEDRAGIAAALSVPPTALLPQAPVEEAGCPVKYAYVGLASPAVVDAVAVNSQAFFAALGKPKIDGVYVFALRPHEPRVYSRFLVFSGAGTWEDPATGSAACPLAAYLVRHRLLEDAPPIAFVIEQGTHMGRQSFLHATVVHRHGDIDSIEIGGSAVFVLSGTLEM